MLTIQSLRASVAGTEILKGLDLTINAGEVHAIMGPNGSGKSTLANVLAGRDDYTVSDGSVTFQGQDLLELEPEERARAGLFLAFQYPVEIPGVNNTYLLRAALNAVRESRGEPELSAVEFMKLAREKMKAMEMDSGFLNRGVEHHPEQPCHQQDQADTAEGITDGPAHRVALGEFEQRNAPDTPEYLDKRDGHGDTQNRVQQTQEAFLVGTAALDRYLAAGLEQVLQHGAEKHRADQ